MDFVIFYWGSLKRDVLIAFEEIFVRLFLLISCQLFRVRCVLNVT